MEVTASFISGAQFKVGARGHEVICDQPVDNGGEDAGLTPPEFLLAALATCAGYYAAQYLKARGLSTEGLSVKVGAGKATQPARLSAFQIDVTTPPIEERHQPALMRAVKSCLVHNTLLGSPAIVVALHQMEPVTAS